MTYNEDEIILDWYKESGCYGRNFSDALFEDIILDEAKPTKQAKQDIQDFIDKFGEDTYKLFKKSIKKLKDAKESTNLVYYTHAMSKKELTSMLAQLNRRIKPGAKRDDSYIRGDYKYFGEKNGFKVYQPLDPMSSMDLGYRTAWRAAGRRSKYAKPSFDKARSNFYDYDGVKFYYFLNDEMEGQYAIALYPKMLPLAADDFAEDENRKIDNDHFITKANFKLYNQLGDLDYSVLSKLPLDLLPDEAGLSYKTAEVITDFVIPEGTKCVDASAMSKIGLWDKLERVVIPNGVTSIGKYAFYGCSSLKSIIIPDSVRSIGEYAFCDCASLTSVTFGASAIFGSMVTSIGKWAFAGCSSLKSIAIPDRVTSIDEYTFHGCSSLTSITFGVNVKSIGYEAFCGCTSLTDVRLDNGLNSIDSCAFEDCSSLAGIIIPGRVTSIGECAFGGCSSLKSIVIPDSVKSIGERIFADCTSLESVTLPFIGSSVTRSKRLDYIFNGFSGFDDDDSSWRAQRSLKEVIVSGRCTSIDSEAFYDWDGLTNITIPNSVTSIGSYAFCSCKSLKSIVIPDSVTYIDGGTFQLCTSITSIIVPDGVTDIGEFAFDRCSSLTSITIPDSVESIDENAFDGCRSLTVKTNNKYVQKYCAKWRIRCEKLSG